MHDILTALFSWIPGQNAPVVASDLKGIGKGLLSKLQKTCGRSPSNIQIPRQTGRRRSDLRAAHAAGRGAEGNHVSIPETA